MSKSTITKLRETPLSLRLLEVCESIPALKFTDHNDEHNFDYVKASQLYEEFRSKLQAQKILLLTDEKEITHADFVDKDGQLWRETTIRIEYELHDCLSDQRICKTHFGSGVAVAHTGFGLYIAKTMGNKYFLRGIAMIPWTEGDQEFQNRKQPEIPESEVAEYRKMSKPERDVDTKIRAWHSAIRQGHKTEVQILTYLVNVHECESIRDLFLSGREEKLKDAMAWAMRDMPDETDVKIAEKAKAARTPRKKVSSIQDGPQPVVPSAEMQREDEVAGD